MTSSLSKYEGKLPSPFNFFIQGHFRSILLDGHDAGFYFMCMVSHRNGGIIGIFLVCVYWSKNWTKKLTPPPLRMRIICHHHTRVSVATYINLETCKIQG